MKNQIENDIKKFEEMYTVYVDDNAHYKDEEYRSKRGSFSSIDEAINECKRIVDAYLKDANKPGMSAAELYRSYVNFGEDSFIVPANANVFSAWNYAKERCAVICVE
jgi:hypothetical protein